MRNFPPCSSNRSGTLRTARIWAHALLSLLVASKPPKFTRRYWIPSLTSLGKTDDHDYSVPIIVTYTNDPEIARKWADKYLLPLPEPSSASTASASNEIQVVGFDLESAPNLPWRKDIRYTGPATVQLSVNDAALVLQIAQDECDGPLHDTLPFVNSVLSHDSLLLAGVGMDQDMVELYRWVGNDDGKLMSDRPLRIDIGGVGSVTTGDSVGLRRLAASIIKVDVPKSRNLARSPWASAPLSEKEIAYAARDAWTSAAVLHRLNSLDPQRFSPLVLRNVVLNEEVRLQGEGKPIGIADLSRQMALRKQCKKEWAMLKEQLKEGALQESESDRMKELEGQIRDLAPNQPIRFEIEERLGITL
jgi:ribonuclease D